MEKIVYSIVLSKNVVEAVDELAATQGKSRSAMINAILAEHTSVPTKENSMWQIVEAVRRSAYDRFNTTVTSGGLLTLRTTLRYKYNPAVSYVLEVNTKPNSVGVLSVGMRTTSTQLQEMLETFFSLWSFLEKTNLPVAPHQETGSVGTKKYIRTLRHLDESKDERQEGQAIAAYVNLMDDCLRKFFEYAQDMNLGTKAVSDFYKKELPNLGIAQTL